MISLWYSQHRSVEPYLRRLKFHCHTRGLTLHDSSALFSLFLRKLPVSLYYIGWKRLIIFFLKENSNNLKSIEAIQKGV